MKEFCHFYHVNEDERRRYDLIFEKELLPHINALSTFAFHLTLNEDDADDLVQETYLKAYRFIDKYLEGTNAKAWLFKILKTHISMSIGERAKRLHMLIMKIS